MNTIERRLAKLEQRYGKSEGLEGPVEELLARLFPGQQPAKVLSKVNGLGVRPSVTELTSEPLGPWYVKGS